MGPPSSSSPATTSLVARTGERSVVPVLVAQRLEMAVDHARRQSCETDNTEEEEERRGASDLEEEKKRRG